MIRALKILIVGFAMGSAYASVPPARRAGPLPSPQAVSFAAPAAPALSPMARAINAERARKRLPPLAEDARLGAFASSWAAWMATNRKMIHEVRRGDFARRMAEAYPGRASAENIAPGPTVEAAVAAWMASPGHRANVLGNYRLLGVGMAVDATGRWYFCADFVR